MTAEIDMTPNFEQATKMCMVVLENGTPEGKAQARDELLRYARELDRLAAQAKAPSDNGRAEFLNSEAHRVGQYGN